MESVEDALKLIQSNPDGVLQSELWKLLGVDSRKCSRIVKKLLDDELIERLEYRKEGIKTFVLKAKRNPVDPNLLGGIEVRVGGKVYDASIRTRIEKIRESITLDI